LKSLRASTYRRNNSEKTGCSCSTLRIEKRRRFFFRRHLTGISGMEIPWRYSPAASATIQEVREFRIRI
jgi:hypothetical protein